MNTHKPKTDWLLVALFVVTLCAALAPVFLLLHGIDTGTSAWR